jgi:hypothetical protein
MIRKLFLCTAISVCYLLGTGDLRAQIITEESVKLSGKYHWGEGFSADRQEAIDMAKKDLIERLVVTVSSETSMDRREQSSVTNSSEEGNSRQLSGEMLMQMQTQTFSRMQLRGLDYLAEQRRDKSWEVVAYISKEDLKRSVDEQKKALLSSLDQALKLENQGDINRAMLVYHETYLNTYFLPEKVYTDSTRHGTEAELRRFLNQRIDSWLNDISIKTLKPRSLPNQTYTEIYIPLSVTYNNEPVENMVVQIDKNGMPPHLVQNGKAEIYTDLAPENRTERISVLLRPTLPPQTDETIAAISEGSSPTLRRAIAVDHSPIISITFTANRLADNSYRFKPTIKNLSVFSTSWDLDGEYSTDETSPRYTFQSDDFPKTISFMINQSDELTQVMELEKDGTLRRKQIAKEADSRDSEILNNRSEKNSDEENSLSDKTTITSPHASRINNWLSYSDAQELVRELQRLSRLKVLRFGNKSAVTSTAKSYIAIINPTDKTISAILGPEQNDGRMNFTQKNPVQDVAAEFKGQGSIWIEFN